jgi:hypothetical protein
MKNDKNKFSQSAHQQIAKVNKVSATAPFQNIFISLEFVIA